MYVDGQNEEINFFSKFCFTPLLKFVYAPSNHNPGSASQPRTSDTVTFYFHSVVMEMTFRTVKVWVIIAILVLLQQLKNGNVFWWML